MSTCFVALEPKNTAIKAQNIYLDMTLMSLVSHLFKVSMNSRFNEDFNHIRQAMVLRTQIRVFRGSKLQQIMRVWWVNIRSH